ncbi:17965_t:CDS:2, partial [Acaulospora morrowiae]
NASSHQLAESEIEELSNIKLYFLPPNTTSHLQPIDQGIISSFKVHYRKLLCEDRIRAFDEHHKLNIEIPKLNILNAINWTAQAWNSVTNDTIYHCWQKTGILPNDKMHEGESELKNELEAEENEIQLLIHQMNVDNIVASDYINIDTRIEITDIIDEGDIIAA